MQGTRGWLLVLASLVSCDTLTLWNPQHSTRTMMEINNRHMKKLYRKTNTSVTIINDNNYTGHIAVYELLTPTVKGVKIQNEVIDLKPVNCTFPALKYMALNEGNIAAIPAAAFRNVPNVRMLDLKFNNIKDINIDAFEGLSGLQSLNLLLNEISTLPEGVFRHSPNLLKINLPRNRITELKSNLFSGLSKLKYLSVNDNEVELTIHDRAFSNLPNLHSLRLVSSGITRLPEDALINTTNLLSLELSYNNLTDIPKRLFFSLEKLEFLGIRYNNLETLDDEVFYNLKNLKKLYLDGNSIKVLRPALFENTIKLGVLSLPMNNITISKTDNVYPATTSYLSNQTDKQFELGEPLYSPFQNLRNLRELYLSNNNISVICTDWRSSYSLDTLDLSDNTIPFLSSEDTHFRSGTTVDLSGNEIEYFDPYVYENNQPTRILIMGQQPYNCSCAFLPFIQKYSRKDVFNLPFLDDIDEATCIEPNNLKEKKLVDLSESSLGTCILTESNSSDLNHQSIL